MIFGYLRVSTEKQDVEKQRLEVFDYARDKDYKVDEFIEVKVSATKTIHERRIDELIDLIGDGDILILVELSRIGRSLIDVLSIIQRIHDKGGCIEFIRQPFLNTTMDNPFQKVLLSMFAVFAEVERDFIVMRTKAGLDKARLSKKLGRPVGSLGKSKLDEKLLEVNTLVNAHVPVAAIARIMKVSESTLRRWAKRRGILLKSIEALKYMGEYK